MTKKDTKIRVFVYGTLKQGKGLNAYYMRDSKFLKKDTIKGELYSFGSYPVLFEGDKDVPGEVFDMKINSYDIMRNMEESAGYETKSILTDSGENVMVFFYRFEDAKIKENLIYEW